MDKKHDLVCDQCGAMMVFNDKRTEMHCEYCGNVVVLPQNENNNEKIAYARRKAEMDASNEHYQQRVRNQRKQQNIAKLIAILVVVGILLTPISCAFIPYIFRPTVNPFDFIEVTFDGIDGTGYAKVELIKTNDKIHSLNDLGITISKESGLSEGETITVYADALEAPYWFSENSKEYVVDGLDLFLTDLKDMEKNTINLIHQKSLQILDFNISDTPQINNLRPEKFYLLTDGKKDNLMYDVFSADWNLADGSIKQIYLVAYYTDIMVHNGDNPTFDYDNCMYTGEILSTSDYRNNVVTGFDSIEDIELDLNTNRDSDWVLTERTE